MKYIQDVDNQEHLKEFVLQDLKEKYGLKIPKCKKNKTRDDSLELGRNIFGNHLCLMPCVYVDSCGPVPKFLVEASALLEKHADTEGLFRKSGSVARQKELKQKIESGEDLNDANPLDLGSLLKQFFRELPDPLLTSRYHDLFIRAFSLDPESKRVRAMLLLCLILPWHHLCVLRYMMVFLKEISAHSDSNKMDIQNLAVCLAPNLLYSAFKSDRLHMSESKLLQIQTNIVQLLICHADTIGMVCETLIERTNLMGSLFPSEDELDRSDTGHNDSKSSKKKKKRSASFQGIMSNLSSSFSKWRKDTTKHHHNASNVSERSGYSFTSMADKSSVLIPDHPDSLAYLEALGYPEMTPKMIRKRKAEDEVVPFSASKKQAILQSMPQMSVLGGTPFTPATVKRGARAAEFFDTPSIKFSEGGETVFAATPRYKMDRYLSTPLTGMKDKQRKSPNSGNSAVGGKAGCFSPKTPRNSVRRTMKGFLKRLSGGKEQQGLHVLDASERLANTGPDYVTIIEASSSSKRRSFFGKHRKTPSSPARLITPNMGRNPNGQPPHMPKIMLSNQGILCNDSTSPNDGDRESVQNAETAAPLNIDPSNRVEIVPHKRRYSDTAPGSGLKRGKPNTLKTGLPSPSHRRSIEPDSVINPKNYDDDTERSARHRFLSPDKFSSNCVASTVDTSPILKTGSSAAMDMTNLDDDDISASRLSRQISQTSVISSMSLAEQTQMESDHDRAFIHESMLCLDDEEDEEEEGEDSGDDEMEESEESHDEEHSEDEEVDEEGYSEAGEESDMEEGENATPDNDGVFIHPAELDSKAVIAQGTCSGVNAEESSSNREKCDSVDSIGSVSSIPGRGVKTHTVSVESLDSVIRVKPHTNSVESLDSAISDCQQTGAMSKYTSLQSVKSFDSGLSMSDPNNPKMSSSISLYEKQPAEGVEKVSSGSLVSVGQESSVLLQRHGSIRSRAKDPKLRISQDVHTLLTKVGGLGAAGAQEGISNGSQGADQENIENKCELESSEPDTQSVEAARQEIAQRRASPHRFPNSVSRQRGGVSPVRIPSIFVKADKDAARYRQLANAAIRMSPGRKKPFLPLSTNLVNASSVLEVRSRLDCDSPLTTDTHEGSNSTSTAGHTPSRIITDNTLHSTEIEVADITNRISKNNPSTPQATGLKGKSSLMSTPQIKSSLVTGGGCTPQIKSGFFSRGGVSSTPSSSLGPLKPIKRLQGTGGFTKSPKKVIGVMSRPADRRSPIPAAQIKEWSM